VKSSLRRRRAALDLSSLSAAELARPLAELHQSLEVGATQELRLCPDLRPSEAREILAGAGFAQERSRAGRSNLYRLSRLDTLPDYLRPDLRLLVCGLNPSPHAAATGIPFGRPGNRFWPAALEAGLVARDRDVWAALEAGLGFTDWVKRPTRRAAELHPDEYIAGSTRLEALIGRHRPAVTCFVGLEGFRRACDREARPGWVETKQLGTARLGTPRLGSRLYLMPSTSGLNAHAKLADLIAHLRRAWRAAA